MTQLAVVAIGGNSLIEDPKNSDVLYQWDAVRKTSIHIADMIAAGWRVVVTHGNGPQAGFFLRRSELAAQEVHTLPLDSIVAATQGTIGFMLQQALENEFRRRGLQRSAVTLLTQTLVNADDPAFADPSKPIGGYLSPEQAEEFRTDGWTVVEDAGRGLRRVVASPTPCRIVEEPIIRRMVEQGIVVVASGGGGIPVVENEAGELRSLPAVIDKDLTASLLACSLQADLFLISTAVAQVALNFNTPDQQNLSRITVGDARRYYDEGHFLRGSMGPKVQAVIQFLEAGGPRAIITSPSNLMRAIAGEAGTTITG